MIIRILKNKLHFQVLSGQYLHVDEDSYLPIRVDVETVGVPEDCAILNTEVRIEIYLITKLKWNKNF